MLFLDPVTGQPLEGKPLFEARLTHLQQLISSYHKTLDAEGTIFAYKGVIIYTLSETDKAKLQPIKGELETKVQEFVAKELFNPENK